MTLTLKYFKLSLTTFFSHKNPKCNIVHTFKASQSFGRQQAPFTDQQQIAGIKTTTRHTGTS
jgi:hypothetical protein